MVHNLQMHHGGRVWVLWQPQEFVVTVLSEHAQFLQLLVKSKCLRKESLVTVVHGANQLRERKLLWQKLTDLAATIQQPWVLGGDFNNVLYPHEHQGGSAVQLFEITYF